MEKTKLIADELWDHYSGLPSPLWYQQPNEPEDEENNTDPVVNPGLDTAKDQEKKKKQMGSLIDKQTKK